MTTIPDNNHLTASSGVQDQIHPERIPEFWRNDLETAAQKLPEECQRNQTVFWSGSPNRHFGDYSMNRAAAEIWAEWRNKKTLEMTSLGQSVDKAYESEALSSEEKYEISKYASSLYARNARGEVTAFVREARFDGHYSQIERPSLPKNDIQLTEMTFGSGRLEQEMRIIKSKLEFDMYQHYADTGRIRDHDERLTKAHHKYSQSCAEYKNAYHDISWLEAKDKVEHYQQVLEGYKKYESAHSIDKEGIAERKTVVKDIEGELQRYPTTRTLIERNKDFQKGHDQKIIKEDFHVRQPRSKLGQKIERERQQRDHHKNKDSPEKER